MCPARFAVVVGSGQSLNYASMSELMAFSSFGMNPTRFTVVVGRGLVLPVASLFNADAFSRGGSLNYASMLRADGVFQLLVVTRTVSGGGRTRTGRTRTESYCASMLRADGVFRLLDVTRTVSGGGRT